MDVQQFQTFAADLLATPPEARTALVVEIDGQQCHCALGKLADRVGVPAETMYQADAAREIGHTYETLILPALQERYGISEELSAEITDANDWVMDDVRLSREENALRRAKTVIRRVADELRMENIGVELPAGVEEDED